MMSVAERPSAMNYGDFETRISDTNMQRSDVVLEHARPIFPSLRIILFISTETKAMQIGGSGSSEALSGRRMQGILREELDGLVDGMMVGG